MVAPEHGFPLVRRAVLVCSYNDIGTAFDVAYWQILLQKSVAADGCPSAIRLTADRHRTHRALLKGEYDRFSEAENEFVSNLFYTNPMRPESPLLAFYLLWILRQRLNSVRDEGVESKHWHASELCAVFEGCGVADELVTQVLDRLYERRLIEALDPNVKHIGVGDRVAIKDSGLAHIELVLNSPTYIEQTALTTGVNELFTRDEMRKNNYPQKMEDVRSAFVRYLLKIDAGRVTIPTSKVYEQIGLARRQIERMTPRKRSSGRLRPDELLH